MSFTSPISGFNFKAEYGQIVELKSLFLWTEQKKVEVVLFCVGEKNKVLKMSISWWEE